MAMDVDLNEDSTQQPKEVDDYGLAVDFSGVEEEDLEVTVLSCSFYTNAYISPESAPR